MIFEIGAELYINVFDVWTIKFSFNSNTTSSENLYSPSPQVAVVVLAVVVEP